LLRQVPLISGHFRMSLPPGRRQSFVARRCGFIHPTRNPPAPKPDDSSRASTPPGFGSPPLSAAAVKAPTPRVELARLKRKVPAVERRDETDEKMATALAGRGYHINRSNLVVVESKTDMQKVRPGEPGRRRRAGAVFARLAAGESRGARRRRRDIRRVPRWEFECKPSSNFRSSASANVRVKRPRPGRRHLGRVRPRRV
jgi:hypothetical protein